MEWIVNIRHAARAMGGEIFNCADEEVIKSVSTDTRTVESGALFFALKGERFDGYCFAQNAIERGAICAVISKDHRDFEKMPVIVVEDTHKALRDFAAYYRRKFHVPVVGVTGSVGKTSTKEMIASVLKQKYEVHATKGNFNNEIGLPLTVFGLSAEHELMVLEMGMSNFGEISNLTHVAMPDTAVITNIGISHIEHLKSREGIRKAKFEIMEGLQMDGTVILNGDDDLLAEAHNEIEFETLYYGIRNKSCDLLAQNVRTYSDSTEFQCKIDGALHDFSLSLPGEHHVYNALVAILVGMKYNVDMKDIKKGIREYTPSGMRQAVLEYGPYKVIQDCYNASPASMNSGLEVLHLTESHGRKVACLADMLELGEVSQKAHEQVGSLVVKYGIDCLITVGKEAHGIARGAINAGMSRENVHEYENNEALKQDLVRLLKNRDCILLKGSRGMHLEEITAAIEQLNQ